MVKKSIKHLTSAATGFECQNSLAVTNLFRWWDPKVLLARNSYFTSEF